MMILSLLDDIVISLMDDVATVVNLVLLGPTVSLAGTLDWCMSPTPLVKQNVFGKFTIAGLELVSLSLLDAVLTVATSVLLGTTVSLARTPV